MCKPSPHFVVCFNRWFLPLMCFPVVFFSCEQELDEEELRALIMGTWYSESVLETTPPLIYRNETAYLQDGTFTYTQKVLDMSRKVLGYAAYQESAYRIDGDTLITFDTDYYGLDNESPYLELEELQLHDSSEAEIKTLISFNPYYTVLTLDYGLMPCLMVNIKGICIQYVTLERENGS
jgi:hypothetical protein